MSYELWGELMPHEGYVGLCDDSGRFSNFE